MKKLLSLILIPILSVFLFAACGGKTAADEKEENPAGVNELILSETVKAADGSVAAEVSYSVPTLNDALYEGAPEFNKFFENCFNEAKSAAGTAGINTDTSKKTPWSFTSKYEITYEDENYVSVVLYTRSVSPAGITTLNRCGRVFSYAEGRVCTVFDFSSNSEDYVRGNLCDLCGKRTGVRLDEETREQEDAEAAAVLAESFDSRNFVFDDDEVTLFFSGEALSEKLGVSVNYVSLEYSAVKNLLEKIPSF